MHISEFFLYFFLYLFIYIVYSLVYSRSILFKRLHLKVRGLISEGIFNLEPSSKKVQNHSPSTFHSQTKKKTHFIQNVYI
jgi:hypothetical protein